MDFVKMWGNLLAASGGGTNVCTLPTTYFMQGVHVFAYANDTNSSCLSTASSTSSASSLSGESDENTTYVIPDTSEQSDQPNIPIELNADEQEVSDEEDEEFVDENTNDNEFGANIEDSTEEKRTATNRRRIQRIRYSREEYKCTTCPYTCTTEKAFFKHLRTCDCENTTESEPTRLSCPICGKDRNGEQLILAHMMKHKEGKQFCCDLCKFRTLQLKKLIQHRRMHTGEKPHLCPFCTYRSARRDNLRSHVRRVHKKENLTCDTFTPRSMLLTPSKEKYNFPR